QDVVDLDGGDPVGGLQQRQGERAEPRADLDDHVVGAYLGGADDTADRVRVDDEVLAALLGGPHAEGGREFADVGGAQEGVGGGAGHGTRVRGGRTARFTPRPVAARHPPGRRGPSSVQPAAAVRPGAGAAAGVELLRPVRLFLGGGVL